MQVFDYDLEEVKKHLKGDQALLSLIEDYGL